VHSTRNFIFVKLYSVSKLVGSHPQDAHALLHLLIQTCPPASREEPVHHEAANAALLGSTWSARASTSSRRPLSVLHSLLICILSSRLVELLQFHWMRIVGSHSFTVVVCDVSSIRMDVPNGMARGATESMKLGLTQSPTLRRV
jgi:hypothetical protein